MLMELFYNCCMKAIMLLKQMSKPTASYLQLRFIPDFIKIPKYNIKKYNSYIQDVIYYFHMCNLLYQKC